MKEELISFNTAKLAKEKGFDNYVEGDIWAYANTTCIPSSYNKKECIHISSQSLLQKWLREVHTIHMNVMCQVDHWELQFFRVGKNDWMSELREVERIPFKTYEECLERGLQEALKLIKI